LPEGITGLGDGDFLKCTSIETLTIPEGVSDLPDNFLAGLKSLKSVTFKRYLPDNIKPIPSFPSDGNIFIGCPNTVTIMVPSGSIDVYKASWIPASNSAHKLTAEQFVEY
jgi:hypothetical protein